MKSNSKFRLIAGVSAVALFSTAALVAPALANSDTSTIQGKVTNAAVGARVSVVDTATNRKYETSVRADGSYILVGLRPGSYRVSVGGVAEEVTLAVGTTTIVDLSGAAGETVVVVGSRRKEVRTSEIATSVSPAQMRNLPQNDRNFLNFAALAPGLSVSPAGSNKQVQAGGVSADQVNVFINGSSLKNRVGHGGVSGQSFSKGNPFPQSAVQEFKVSTQNFKAEFEQAGSAVISAVTKSGGNEFHGGAFYELVNKDMYGQPFFERANPKPDYKRDQYGFDIGGPIIKDKLFFFVAYEGTKQNNPSRTVEFTSPAVPAAIKAANAGSFADPFQQDLIFGKLTWAVNDSNELSLSYFKREEEEFTDYGGREARSHGRNINNTIDEFALEHKYRTDKFVNEASLVYQKTDTGTPAITDGPEIVLTDGVNGPDVAALGAHFFTQTGGHEAITFKNNITFTDVEWRGRHVIKAGVKINDITLSRAENWFTNGRLYFNAATYTGFATSTPYQAQVSIAPSGLVEAQNTEIGLFIQDDWTVNDKLTLNLGIRWDYETNMMNNKYVTPAHIATALRAYTGWQAAGINPEDYISNGSDRESFKGAFQPRLGFSYDVNGDRDLVLFGGIGRYYDRTIFTAAMIEYITNNLRNEPVVATTSKDIAAIRNSLINSGQRGSVWLVPDNLKVPYTDQFNLGVRKRFGNIQSSLAFAYNRTHDVFQYVRGNRMPDGTFSPLGDGYVIDNFPAAGQLPGFNGKLNIGANGGQARYKAIYLTLEDPMTGDDKYGFTAAFTFTDAEQLGSELDADEFFAGPRQDVFGWTKTPNVDKFRFVGTGVAKGPWDTILSTTVTLGSGGPFGSIDGRGPNPPNACCIANLSGVYYPDVNIAYRTVDFRVAKDINMPNGNTLTVSGQVFNAFDWVNKNWSSWGGGANWGGGPSLQPDNSTKGPARTFQVGLAYRF